MYLKVKVSMWDDPFGNTRYNFCYLNICNSGVYGFYICERRSGTKKYDIFIKDRTNNIKLELASYSSLDVASKALEWLIVAINNEPEDSILEMPSEDDILSKGGFIL